MTKTDMIGAGLNVPALSIESYISSGSFGSVYKAHDTNDPELQYVVKAQEEHFGHFWCELVRHVVLASRLHSEYSVQLLGWDFYKQDELEQALPHVPESAVLRFYFELGSEDLSKYAKRVLVPLLKKQSHVDELISETLIIMERVSACIVHYHKKQVLHRDLKLENILLVGDKWKISDPGSVKAHDMTQEDNTAGRGTKYYVPSETIQKIYGPFTDIFSLAAITGELLTGKLHREQVYRGKYFDDNTVFHHPQVGTALRGLMAKATDKNYHNRPEAVEFLEAIQDMMVTMGLEPHHIVVL